MVHLKFLKRESISMGNHNSHMKDSFHTQWHITNLCNLRCQHCYQDNFSREKDLDWLGLKRVADNLLGTIKEWDKTACIHLTGGEPLLKPELFPLLDYLDQNPLIDELGIITNGLLFDQETIKKLSAFPKLKKIKSPWMGRMKRQMIRFVEGEIFQR